MAPRMNPLVNVEYFASLIVGGGLANSLIGGVPATLIGAFLGAALFFALSMTILVVPISAALWGYGVWFIMDFITQGSEGPSAIAAIIAATLAGASHLQFYKGMQGHKPPKDVQPVSGPQFSPYTKYVDDRGREYDEHGNEVV